MQRPHIIKSALRSDAHSHERQMSAKADHARRSKSPPGMRALGWRGVMSLKRPAAGGESCKAGFYFTAAAAGESDIGNFV